MAKPFDFGGVNLSVGDETASARVTPETPFCIAVLGDFSGRGNRKISDAATIGNRRNLLVDRDNFDEVLARFAPEIDLPIGEEGSLHLQFSDLDDFHPDRVFERLAAFDKLRDLRTRLQEPSTFAAAADELGLRSAAPTPANPVPTPAIHAAQSAAKLASGSLLDETIEQTESRSSEVRPTRSTDEVWDFARRAAAQNLVDAPDPRQADILSVLDRANGALMRAILHNPDFQALEAAWRAVFLLVRRLETGPRLKIFLVDVSKAELAADLASSQDLRSTGVYRLLVEKSVQTPGAEPWAVVVGNYSFGPGPDDVEMLGHLANVASASGAPFLAGASSLLLGCPSFAESPHPRDWKLVTEMGKSWAALRLRPEANSVGLILPRFLLRLPYGKKTDSTESFDFEEMSDPPSHEDYLWGNPAFAAALLLAQAFNEDGWDLRPGMPSEINGLPLHVYQRDGESQLKPCTEALLTETAATEMMARGIMPLATLKGQDTVRLVRFQSIAEPLRALAGKWNDSTLPFSNTA